jgi:hypothetical protein
MRKLLVLPALFVLATAARADCNVTVLSDGVPRPTYFARGTTYIEALRGREYSLQISNPMPYRVAVALSVDGLNTIDAKHTDGWNASKWVLDPYESITIDGWQVSESSARRFYFTGERDSYGASLGQTENLGVIEAIFYRERRQEITEDREYRVQPAPPPPAARSGVLGQSKESDDYAATGMGDRTRHDVTTINIDLDPHPVRSVRLRYEFRPQLIKLGVLPSNPSPLERREKARGFCPEK